MTEILNRKLKQGNFNRTLKQKTQKQKHLSGNSGTEILKSRKPEHRNLIYDVYKNSFLCTRARTKDTGRREQYLYGSRLAA